MREITQRACLNMNACILCRYVNEKDLAFFQYHAEGSGAMQGASNWEVLMDKEILGVIKYTSWRRMLPVSRYKAHSS